MRPKGEREGHQLEADDEQVALVGSAASKQQPLSHEEVLQMVQLDQEPGVEGAGGDGWVCDMASVVCQRRGKLGLGTHLPLFDVSISIGQSTSCRLLKLVSDVTAQEGLYRVVPGAAEGNLDEIVSDKGTHGASAQKGHRVHVTAGVPPLGIE